MKRFISILTALAMFVALTNPICACTLMASARTAPVQLEERCASGHRHSVPSPTNTARSDHSGTDEMGTWPVSERPPLEPTDAPSPTCQLHSGTLVANFTSGVDVLPVWSIAPLVTLQIQSILPTVGWIVPTQTREGCDHRVRAERPLLRQHCALIS